MRVSLFQRIDMASATIDKLAENTVNSIKDLPESHKSEVLKDTQFIAKITPIIGVAIMYATSGAKGKISEEKMNKNLHDLVYGSVVVLFKEASSSEQTLIVCKIFSIIEVLMNIPPAIMQTTSKL